MAHKVWEDLSSADTLVGHNILLESRLAKTLWHEAFSIYVFILDVLLRHTFSFSECANSMAVFKWLMQDCWRLYMGDALSDLVLINYRVLLCHLVNVVIVLRVIDALSSLLILLRTRIVRQQIQT